MQPVADGVCGAVADVRAVPLPDLATADLSATLRRVLPESHAVVVPVASFQSAI